jgi:hypothetical protein
MEPLRYEVKNYVTELLKKNVRDSDFEKYIGRMLERYNNDCKYTLVEHISRNPDNTVSATNVIEVKNITTLKNIKDCNFSMNIEDRLCHIFFDHLTFEPILVELLYFFKPNAELNKKLLEMMLRIEQRINSVIEVGIKESVEIKGMLIEISKVILELKEVH